LCRLEAPIGSGVIQLQTGGALAIALPTRFPRPILFCAVFNPAARYSIQGHGEEKITRIG
jgi:hypothetical protein